MMKNLTDDALIERCRRHDSAAFSALVDRHRRMVFRCAYRMMGDEQEAEDITQDVFLRVYQALPRFRGESKFSIWLYKIVSNVCLNRLRKVKPDTVSIEGNDEEQKFSPLRLADPDLTPEVGRLLREHAGEWLDAISRSPSIGDLPGYDWSGRRVRCWGCAAARGLCIPRYPSRSSC